jgi:hypothetical protein
MTDYKFVIMTRNGIQHTSVTFWGPEDENQSGFDPLLREVSKAKEDGFFYIIDDDAYIIPWHEVIRIDLE